MHNDGQCASISHGLQWQRGLQSERSGNPPGANKAHSNALQRPASNGPCAGCGRRPVGLTDRRAAVASVPVCVIRTRSARHSAGDESLLLWLFKAWAPGTPQIREEEQSKINTDLYSSCSLRRTKQQPWMRPASGGEAGAHDSSFCCQPFLIKPICKVLGCWSGSKPLPTTGEASRMTTFADLGLTWGGVNCTTCHQGNCRALDMQ